MWYSASSSPPAGWYKAGREPNLAAVSSRTVNKVRTLMLFKVIGTGLIGGPFP